MVSTFVALGDSFTEGLNDPDPGGGYRGLPAGPDWRDPLPSPTGFAGPAATGWLAARRVDARWARAYAAPWVRRRMKGVSTGDGREPKRPGLLAWSAGSGAAEVSQDLLDSR